MRKTLPLQHIVQLIRPGMRVLLHAGPSECLALRDALRTDPERAAGVTFTGLFIPGVNTFDYASLTPTTRVETVFAAPSARASFEAGHLDLHPVHYSSFSAFLTRHPADLAILHLPPERSSMFSCGIGADVAEGVRRLARRVAVITNASIPFTSGGIALRADEAEVVAEHDAPLPSYPVVGDDAVLSSLARHVADFVDDGDTLQIGIGRLPTTVMGELTDRRRLRLHSGMMIDAVATLLDAGAVAAPAPGAPPIVTGIALGSAAVHAAARHPSVAFHGIGVTHDARRIAGLPRFTAINSALEVDLFGNINCERLKGRQVSGIGGVGDFARAARLSDGGRAIIALPSEAGGTSRIVPCLPAGATSIARADADILVTEHGSAALRDLGLDARAEAILAIAAPTHRSQLAAAWQALRANL